MVPCNVRETFSCNLIIDNSHAFAYFSEARQDEKGLIVALNVEKYTITILQKCNLRNYCI